MWLDKLLHMGLIERIRKSNLLRMWKEANFVKLTLAKLSLNKAIVLTILIKLALSFAEINIIFPLYFRSSLKMQELSTGKVSTEKLCVIETCIYDL